ncbi:hypothetical protein L603_001800000110 [Cellulosimicrobium cellulans J34]|nr:DUF4190 domain-containing protein [Cellulosimicrobium sp. MM]TWG85493.1 hypothetical protein L603_001800000110 [Cellulosimicrobium cellulans J34]SMF25727.1 hypothetical protein SAMN02744115_02276 [Cellulosimicrobium cellulans J1]
MSTPDQPDQNPQQPGGTPSGPPAYGAPEPGQPQQPPQAPQHGAPQAPQYGAPQAPQYNAPQQGSPYSAPGQGEDPGKTMGIVGLVLSFLGCLSIVGLILSIVAYNKSKKAGYKNGVALAGIIVGAVVLVISIIVAIVVGTASFALIEKCNELGPGTHYENGVEYTCG